MIYSPNMSNEGVIIFCDFKNVNISLLETWGYFSHEILLKSKEIYHLVVANIKCLLLDNLQES